MTKQQLIEDNIGLVYSFVAREYPTFKHDEDIIQAGMVGLCQAADRWEAEKSQFSTFAWKCIRNEVLRELKRRFKHQGVLSLDYEIVKDGVKGSLGDIIVGDEDVFFIDDCHRHLTPLERKMVDLLKKGLTVKEVAEALNITIFHVYRTQRKIRILRGRDNV